MEKDRLKNTKIWVGDSTLEEKEKVHQFIGENIDSYYSSINFREYITCYFIDEELNVSWDGDVREKFISTDHTYKELTPSELLGEQYGHDYVVKDESSVTIKVKDGIVFVENTNEPPTNPFDATVERIKLLKSEIQAKQTELNELIDKLKTL